ncbi:hypothetical protein OAN72_00715 [bacterium]|nr:hypothetical protein [bacterium]
MKKNQLNQAALGALLLVVAALAYFSFSTPENDLGQQGDSELEMIVSTSEGTENATLAVEEEHVHSSNCAHCQAQKTSTDAEPILSTKPELDHIFKGLAACKDRIIPKSTFDFFKGRRVGDKASVEIAGQEYAGRVSVVRENHELARTYGMALDDRLGGLLVTTDAGGSIRGHLLFLGDSRTISFNEVKSRVEGSKESSLVFYENQISDVFCAAPGSVYNGVGASLPGTKTTSYNVGIGGAIAANSIAVSAFESIPDSEYVIYLDFDGEEVTNTPWNLMEVNGLGDIDPIIALPVARADEEEWVELVWSRVVEDFTPFNINVTTDRDVFDLTDIDKRLHVVITLTNTAAVGAGGVAFLHSFREDSPIVWAFNSDEGECAATISHEAGHSFGLSHDGLVTPLTEYYGGHNSDYEPGWAPIMGAYFADGTTDEVNQWSRGQYLNASNLEDDIEIIGDNVDPQLGVVAEEFAEEMGVDIFGNRYYDLYFPNGVGISNGFGFKSDDIADTIVGAVAMSITGEDLVEGDGFIGTSSDVDVFSFVAPAGDLQFIVSPLDVDSTYTESGSETSGADLAVDIQLLNADGIEIASGEDVGDNELGSALRTYVDEGTYYLRVEGGARGIDPSSGFSEYASMGEYSIVGQLDTPPLVVYGGDKQTVTVFEGDTGVSVDNGTDFGFSTPTNLVTNVFLLENIGTVLEIDNISISLASGMNFRIETPIPTGPISPEGAKELIITYSPTTTGVHEDTVIIEYVGDGDEVYEFAVRGIATISATEDNYEDNDLSTQAFDLTAYEDVYLGNIEGPAFFLSDQVDFYSFTTAPGDEYVQVDFFLYEFGNVQFDLYIITEGGTTLVQTSNAIFGSLLYIIPEEFGEGAFQFLVKVTNLDDISVRNEYNLTWSAFPLSTGEDDFYEDNDSQGEAFDLTGNEGRLSDYLLLATLSDEDWYKITVPNDPFARMLYVSALFDDAQGNIDIAVYKEGETEPVDSSDSEDNNEVLTIHDEIDLTAFVTEFSPENNQFVIGVEPGTYYIRVYGDYAGNEYDLIVETIRDDRYEEGDDDPETENDAQEDAFPLGETIVGKWLSEVDGAGTVAAYEVDATAANFANEGDSDWFAFSLPAGEAIQQLTLEYDYFDGGDGGSVQFYIVDELGVIVAESDDTSPLEGILTLTNPADLNYWILVEPTDSRQWLTGYDFRVNFTAQPPFVEDPIEDNYEQNDNSINTFNISTNEGRWLSSLDGYGTKLDPDYFSITVPDDALSLEVTLFHYSAEGDMDLLLVGPAGGITNSAGNGNVESIVSDISEHIGNNYVIGVEGESLGNFYNLFWEVTRFDDNYEENDSLIAATDLTSHENRFLNKLEGSGIQRDEDWFMVSAADDTVELRIDLVFNHGEGDIDMSLHNASGSIIDRSITTTNNEQISFLSPPPGDYYVRLYYGDAGNEYDMLWNAYSQAELDALPLIDDLYEEHGDFTNNNTQEQSFDLDETQIRLSGIRVYDEELDVEVQLGLGIQKDDDWYQIEIPEGNTGLRVECLFTDADGDIDMEVYDPIGFPVAIRDSKTSNELLDIRTPVPAGTYSIRIYGVDQGNEYDLYWTAYIDDKYEDNDDRGEAADIQLELGGPLEEPTLGDDDWYVFTASGDDPFIRVDISYLNQNGAIDFQVLDEDFNVLETVDSTENIEFVLFQVTAGTYYVHVYGDDFYNPYDMTISVIGDDEYEENDISDEAKDITTEQAITAVQFDDDWYRFEVTEANSFLSVIASFTHANGNIDLALYAAANLLNPLGTSTTQANNETIRVEGTPGIYYIKVTGDDSNQAYQLLWTVTPDDQYEDNDLIGDAFEITDSEGAPIDAIQFDEDWFEIEVEPGHIRVFFDLDFINAEGDLNLAIFNSDEEELMSVDTEEDGENIILPINPFGNDPQYFYIRVAGSGVGSAYQLTWDATKEDNFEGENGNNVIENASDALLGSEGQRISSTIGYAGAVNDDWYTIPINAGDDGVVIELFYEHTEEVNIEMELFTAVIEDPEEGLFVGSGTFLRRSTGDAGVERIHYTGSAGQTYYLRVYGSNSAKPYDLIWNSYSEDNLEIGVETGNTPQNPPDNDNPETPRGLMLPRENISTRGTRDLEFIKLEGVTQLDEDWYVVEVFSGEDIFILEIEFEHAQGDIDMALYLRVDGEYTLIDKADSQDDNERLELFDLQPGSYLICVYGYGITNPKDDIDWSFDPATQNYSSIEGRTENADDDGDNFDLTNFELPVNDPNGQSLKAYGLANTYSLQWISSVEDRFDVPTDTLGDVEINDSFDLAASADLFDQYLVDQFGDEDEDNIIDDIERFRPITDVDVTPIPSIGYRRVFTISNLAQFDDDWFKFDVNTQGIFYGAMGFNPQHGDLKMFLYDSSGELVIDDGIGAFRIDNFGQNTYYIQIVGNDLGVPYFLELTGAEDDSFEENDDLVDADANANITSLAGSMELINIFIQRDVDLYRVDIPEHQVHLYANTDEGLTLEILDADGNPLPGGYEQSGGTQNDPDYAYGVISPEAGTYYIKVTGDNFGSPYSLEWDYDNVDEYEGFGLNDRPEYITADDDPNNWLNNSNLSRYLLGPQWINGRNRNWNYQSPIQRLAFDYSLLGGLELGNPYTDPFGHAIQESDDWYAVQIPSWIEATARKGNDTVNVLKRLYYTRMSAEIEFTHTDGDINMEIWEDDPESPGDYRLLSRTETTSDIELLNVAIDPLDEGRFYYIHVYGDNAANDYSLKWDFTAEDGYEHLEDDDPSNDQNSFVDRAFDLTNADDMSTEGIWLHEIEYLVDVDGDDDIDANDGGVTARRGYGEQTDTDDWYAVVVSEGATQIEVECIAYSDNDVNYIYGLDNLDIDFEVYYLSGNDDDPNTVDLRKPVLIGRSDSDTDNGGFIGTGTEKAGLTEDITTGITEGPATFDVAGAGIYFIRIYYDNRDHPYTFKWDDTGGVEDSSGDAGIIADYLFGNWSMDLTDSNLPELLQVPFANADGDRWPNWGEYALGLDWEVFDLAMLGQDIVQVGGADYYQFDYLRHKDAKARGFVFTVVESEDLEFDGTVPVFTGTESVDDDFERVYFRSTTPASELDKCFFRLSVTPPESFGE